MGIVLAFAVLLDPVADATRGSRLHLILQNNGITNRDTQKSIIQEVYPMKYNWRHGYLIVSGLLLALLSVKNLNKNDRDNQALSGSS